MSAGGFLGYAIGEATPEHSSFTVIGDRLGVVQPEAIHGVLPLGPELAEGLAALPGHGLRRGRQPGIDSSVIEANASLRALEHRHPEESYRAYVRRLAVEAGLDPDDTKAVRRFDRKREGRRTSHKEGQNPHEPEAKVGRTKHGACDMTDQPEHMTDLDSGAIVPVEVRPGDAADHDESLCERVLAAVGTRHAALPEQTQEKLGSE